MKASQIVKALADLASKGKYNVTRDGANEMNDIFEEAARLINELEAHESQGETNVRRTI